jgi:hypothetical protein
MALESTQPLTEMSKGLPVRKTDNLTANLWADCLENVRASMSHNPIGFHGLLQGQLYLIIIIIIISWLRHYATIRKVAVSIPEEVIAFFQLT